MAVDQADGAETSAIPNVVSFPYYIRNGSQRIKFCLKEFTSIHWISRERIRRIQQWLILKNRLAKDGCGKHGHYYKAIPEPVVQLIR